MHPSCLAVVSSSLQNKAEFQQGDKEMLKRRSGQSLWVCLCSYRGLEGIPESVPYPISARYERHRWEHLEGRGRSQSLVLLQDLHSLLPVICPWVPALLLSMPCASISSFLGVGLLCSIPGLVYGKGRSECFSWGQDLSDLVWLHLYKVAACLF